MPNTRIRPTLTHDAARRLVDGAVGKADEIGVPMCIAVTDDGGQLLAFVRMDGARMLSIETAIRKARTAATLGQPTGGRQPDLAVQLGFGTDGQFTNLPGGLPVEIEGSVVGAIGVGSGTGDQDVEVGHAGIAALTV